MAGLAATLNAPGAIERIATALAPRGDDGALCRLDGAHGARFDLAVRAVIPTIARVVGGSSGTHPVGAFALDGIASVTALDMGYADAGPVGLIGGTEPYAVILADAERELLVVARNGDGPGLYYAALGQGWLVASEPVALLTAGIVAEPDTEVVRRYVGTGRCDDTEATFFVGVRRVLANEAVVLGRDGQLRRLAAPRPAVDQAGETTASETVTSAAVSAGAALRDAVSGGHVAIRLAPGVAGAALLGTALARPDRLRPLPVHTTTLSGVDGPVGHTPGVLVPMPHNAITHIPHTFTVAALDIDGFLRDVGEPVPDIDFLLSWEVVRRCADGLVDTIVDSAMGSASGCLVRVRDRLAARYGVGLRCPLRTSGGSLDELESVATRTLPASVSRYATSDSARAMTSTDLLLGIRDDVAATVAGASAAGRGWLDEATGVDALRRLHSGEPADADVLFRAYLVERWLRAVVDPLRAQTRSAPSRPPLGDIAFDGAAWSRIPVRTGVFGAGDPVTAKAAWHVAQSVNAPASMPVDSEQLTDLAEMGKGQPWFAILSGKALAVSQHRVCPLWEIRPTPWARALARLATRCQPRLGEAWTMQVAMEDAGFARVTLGIVKQYFGFSRDIDRTLPMAAGALFPPRAGAVAPADGAVVRVPFKPDEAAASLAESLRLALPPSIADLLVGCAIASTDTEGTRLFGYAPGPAAAMVPRGPEVISRLCADNPTGQGDERTPIVVAVRRLVPARQTPVPAVRAIGVAKVSPMR